MNLNFRMHTEKDIDKLVEFWSVNSGWDTIDRKEWERRFYHLPMGRSEIAIAENTDDGAILAQFIFIPTEININGKSFKAFRPFAPVIHKIFQGKIKILEMSKYILRMYQIATFTFTTKGIALLHMLPDPRWARLFHFLKGTFVSFFPLYSLYIKTPFPIRMMESYTFTEIEPFDDRLNDLWAKTSKLHQCSIVRNTETLTWKLSHGNYKTIGIFKQSALIGFSASIYKPKDKQWQICDMLFANREEAILATIQATCLCALDFKNNLPENDKATLTKICILATPILIDALKNLGFEKDNYNFPFVIQLLNKEISKNNILPENWYVSAND